MTLARPASPSTATSQDQADSFNARLRARSFVHGGNIDIAIVGGGATGVELAAELSRMVDLAAVMVRRTSTGACA
jgi:NADH dehydrogenase FAD-containing subunit